MALSFSLLIFPIVLNSLTTLLTMQDTPVMVIASSKDISIFETIQCSMLHDRALKQCNLICYITFPPPCIRI